MIFFRIYDHTRLRLRRLAGEDYLKDFFSLGRLYSGSLRDVS